jgi:hypothetical protein
MDKLLSHLKNFHEILYLKIFQMSLEKIQVSLKSDKNDRQVLHMKNYIYKYISLNSSKNEKCFTETF